MPHLPSTLATHRVKRELAQGISGSCGTVYTKSEIAAARSRFNRRFDPANSRQPKVHKVSPEFAAKLASDPRGKAYWFQEFLKNGEDMAQLEVSFYQDETSRKRIRGRHVWFTRERLMHVYKNEVVVDAMISVCLADQRFWRENPNCPGVREAWEYKVLIDHEEESDHITQSRTVISGNGAIDAQGAQLLRGSMSASHESLPGMPSAKLPGSTVPPVLSSCSTRGPTSTELSGESSGGASDVIETKAKAYAAKLQARAEAAKASAAARAAAAKARAGAKQSERLAQKAELERVKNLPCSKAQKWATGLAKDVGVCAGLIESIPNAPGVLESLKTEYLRRMNEWLLELQRLRTTMENVQNDSEATQLLIAGPLKVTEYHACVKNWKRTSQIKI